MAKEKRTTYEAFYGAMLPELKRAQQRLETLVQTVDGKIICDEALKPVVYCCSRIKAPESVQKKCALNHISPDAKTAMRSFYDLVGVRVVCAFSVDVARLVQGLRECPEISIVREKDYYAIPKPNGYRSYHIQLNLLPEGTPAEIQLRTIATDFWATLEHQIKYKKTIPDEKIIREELKRCADEIASVDLSMQTLRELIEASVSAMNRKRENCDGIPS